MKKFILAVFLGSVLLTPSFNAYAGYVHGYTRSNGTYVNGYERTAADGNPYNNYSFPGNYNPNTGSITGGNADTYLRNYYNNSSYYSPSYPSYTYSDTNSYTYPTTPSCPLNSYASGSSCTCDYGYVSNGTSCVSGSSMCDAQIGYMSNYNNLTKSCECMVGYVLGTSGMCEYQTTNYSSGYYGSLKNTCPAHSSTSLTDSNKCACDVGYTPNSAKNACVLVQQYSNNQPASTCPAHSSLSLTDSSKCSCNTDYKINSTGDACVWAPQQDDSNQLCINKFGSKSRWSGDLNTGGGPVCECRGNSQWNLDQTRCVVR